eukprot:1193653-Prorocentrum_minimum.AAC.1
MEAQRGNTRDAKRLCVCLAFDTDTVKLTVTTLSSHLITREFNSPTNYLRTPYVRVEPYLCLPRPSGPVLPSFGYTFKTRLTPS